MTSSLLSRPAPSRRSLRALDVLAFVQVGLGPFLAIYLQSARHWTPAHIGTALAVSGCAGMLAQMPAGALIDRLRHKRELYAAGAALAAMGTLAMARFSTFPQIIAVQILLGFASAIFPSGIAAMSLGMVGRGGLDRRIGRNETLTHAGNVVLAALMGLFGCALSSEAMLYFAAILPATASLCALCIRAKDINDAWARGANGVSLPANRTGSNLAHGLADRRLVVFALSILLFHLANAAMLPLAGQRISLGHARTAPLCMAVCVVAAQLLMTIVASPASCLAGRVGRKRVFLTALVLLPLRGLLFALNPAPVLLVSVQLLDGISAAIVGVVSVLIVADLTEGSGHFNFTQGVVATATGIGASLSTVLGGCIVERAGYDAAFLALAAIAGTPLILFGLAMPETGLMRMATNERVVAGKDPAYMREGVSNVHQSAVRASASS